MPRSYRHIIIAAVGWLILAAGNPVNQASQPTGAQRQGDTATEASFVAYPKRDSDACYNASDHDKADLCAQWRAAIAAEKSAREAGRATNWAIIATLLSAAGVGGLLYTLLQTHGALNEARRGNLIAMKANARATRQAVSGAADTKLALEIAARNADAVSRQVAIAQDAAAMELRPYISLTAHSDGDVDEPLNFSRDGFIRFKIKNFGKTPAHAVWLYRGAELAAFPIGSTEVDATEGEEVGSLSPGDARTSTIWLSGFNESVFADVKSGKYALLMKFRVEYALPDESRDFDEVVMVISKYHLDAGFGLNRLTSEERQRQAT